METFNELHRQHRDYVKNVLRRFSRDYDCCEDWAQQVWITVWQKRSEFHGRASFRTWLYRLAVNTALYSMRRERARAVLMQQNVHATTPQQPRVLEDICAVETLRAVPARQRRVVLRWLHGYSHEEIAAQLSIAEGTSKSQLSRGREHLRTLYASTAL